ncbi:MAG TPA: DUF3089 domain-containing protein [Candidatus Limnocylindria bacterium]|nr:DUF3089 domain-containing protein [Candidatus Limnocylindria bacterium]
MLNRTVLAFALACSLAALADVAAAKREPPANPYPGYVSAVYTDPATWLCRGDGDDVCDHDLDATVVRPNGRTAVQRFRAARRPKIDCFYAYPTISMDPTGNSDFTPGIDEELFVVRQQAARLGAVCRVFAPIYRQVTLPALLSILAGDPLDIDNALADADLLDAWKHYIANDNDGRGVLLIGHSQGASRLTTLLRNEIDPNPDLRARLVSAVLLGTNFQVPVGADVGGDLQNIPLCRSPKQTGCVISYASFRSTAPPPPNSLFGRARAEGLQAACTNPAKLAGGTGRLVPYFPTAGRTLPIFPILEPDWVDPARGVEITTPFVTLPKFLDAECAESNGHVYLSLIVHGDPDDPRIDDIGGDLTPEWGMHLIDANVAMGNLVRIAKRQARAHSRR